MLASLLILIFIRPFISSFAFPCLNSVYSVLLLIFLIIWLILKGIPLIKIQTFKYPLTLFCLALILSLIFSKDKLNSTVELYKYISGLLLFLIAAFLSNRDKPIVIRTMVLAGLIISLLAIYQYFFGFQHISDYIAKERIAEPFILDYVSRKRVFFPFVTPNTLAGYLIMIIPLALTCKDRIWFMIPLSLALLLTKSLGALLSIFLGLGIYFYLPRPFAKVRGLQGRFGKRKIIFLFGLAIIIGLVFIVRTIAQKQHLQPIFSTVMRWNYWKDTLEIIKAHPLSGIGIGNFNLMQSRYAHNSYLQVWAEMGILGIAAFLWLIISVFKSALGNMKNSVNKNQIAGLITANIVFLIHNFVDFNFFLPEVALIFWVILGLSLSSK